MGRTKKEHRKGRQVFTKLKKTELVTREEWGAKEPTNRVPLQLPVYNVMVKYYTDTPPCENREECMESMRELQVKYMNKGLPDIPYNFLIGGDETVYEGRGWFTMPDKVDEDMPKWDGTSLDIAYIGQRITGNEMNIACGDLLQLAINKKCLVGMFSFEIISGVEEPPVEMRRELF